MTLENQPAASTTVPATTTYPAADATVGQRGSGTGTEASAAKKDEFKSSTTDGVFVSRKMRRNADAAAKAEVAANDAAAEVQADADDQAAYEGETDFGSKSLAEQTHLKEKALLQAEDEARKKYGLDTSETRKADAQKAAEAANKKAAEDLAAQQKAADAKAKAAA
jgi:hypothetical protein